MILVSIDLGTPAAWARAAVPARHAYLYKLGK